VAATAVFTLYAQRSNEMDGLVNTRLTASGRLTLDRDAKGVATKARRHEENPFQGRGCPKGVITVNKSRSIVGRIV